MEISSGMRSDTDLRGSRSNKHLNIVVNFVKHPKAGRKSAHGEKESSHFGIEAIGWGKKSCFRSILIVIPGASRNGELVPGPGGVGLGKLMKRDGD
jgi:hypothetical protein